MSRKPTRHEGWREEDAWAHTAPSPNLSARAYGRYDPLTPAEHLARTRGRDTMHMTNWSGRAEPPDDTVGRIELIRGRLGRMHTPSSSSHLHLGSSLPSEGPAPNAELGEGVGHRRYVRPPHQLSDATCMPEVDVSHRAPGECAARNQSLYARPYARDGSPTATEGIVDDFAKGRAKFPNVSATPPWAHDEGSQGEGATVREQQPTAADATTTQALGRELQGALDHLAQWCADRGTNPKQYLARYDTSSSGSIAATDFVAALRATGAPFVALERLPTRVAFASLSEGCEPAAPLNHVRSLTSSSSLPGRVDHIQQRIAGAPESRIVPGTFAARPVGTSSESIHTAMLLRETALHASDRDVRQLWARVQVEPPPQGATEAVMTRDEVCRGLLQLNLAIGAADASELARVICDSEGLARWAQWRTFWKKAQLHVALPEEIPEAERKRRRLVARQISNLSALIHGKASARLQDRLRDSAEPPGSGLVRADIFARLLTEFGFAQIPSDYERLVLELYPEGAGAITRWDSLFRDIISKW